MPKPNFIFTKYKNSFNVHVSNLEELSVAQIQNIEAFVANRKGFFDFDTYSFTIPKKIEFYEFITLMKHLNLDAKCVEKENKQNREEKIIEFGQYKGMRYKELPDSYIVWLKNNYIGKDRDAVTEELKSRNL